MYSGPVILEFERAQRMRDAFQRIGNRMRKIVHRVDAPVVFGALMGRLANPVQRRVAQIHIWRRHIDFCPEYVRTIFELAGTHALKQIEILFDRSLTMRAVPPRFRQRATMRANLLGIETVDIGLAAFIS